MRSLGMLQIAGGVVAAGVVAAGATAMTGGGVTFAGGTTEGVTGDNQFIGGTVSQTINGVVVNSVTLTSNSDPSGTHITQAVIVIAGGDNRNLTITPTGGTGLTGTATQWKCTGNIDSGPIYGTAPAVVLDGDPATITCVTAKADNSTGGYYEGLASVGLAVS
jgi:hypothetical protein